MQLKKYPHLSNRGCTLNSAKGFLLPFIPQKNLLPNFVEKQDILQKTKFSRIANNYFRTNFEQSCDYSQKNVSKAAIFAERFEEVCNYSQKNVSKAAIFAEKFEKAAIICRKIWGSLQFSQKSLINAAIIRRKVW